MWGFEELYGAHGLLETGTILGLEFRAVGF